MLVKQEQLNPCEVELQVEIEAEKVKSAVDSTYIELGRSVNIPGFRKGKAPRIVLEKFLDEDRVKDRAADKLLQSAYLQALEESELQPYAPADVEVVKFEIGEPLVFKAKVPLPPKVELGQYAGLDVERVLPPLKDEDVEEEIRRILKQHAEYPEITDREAQTGDVVRIETRAESEPDEEPKSNVAVIGKNLPDFDNALVGMKPSEEKVVDVTYPEDYASEELRGKTLPIRTKLCEIHEEKLPELTDEWVKSVFVGKLEEGVEPPPNVVDTVEKLRARISDAMANSASEVADSQVRNTVVHKIVEDSKVDFPQVMVEEEVKDRLKEVLDGLKERKVTLEDYLQYKGTTFEELRREFEQEAREALKMRLVLREIVDKEDIKVEEEDIRTEVRSMAEENRVPVETINAYIEKTDSMPTIGNRILTKKVMDFLVHASNIKNVGQ